MTYTFVPTNENAMPIIRDADPIIELELHLVNVDNMLNPNGIYDLNGNDIVEFPVHSFTSSSSASTTQPTDMAREFIIVVEDDSSSSSSEDNNDIIVISDDDDDEKETTITTTKTHKRGHDATTDDLTENSPYKRARK